MLSRLPFSHASQPVIEMDLHEQLSPGRTVRTPNLSTLFATMYRARVMAALSTNQWILWRMPMSTAAALVHFKSDLLPVLMPLQIEITLVLAAPALNDEQRIQRMNIAQLDRL